LNELSQGAPSNDLPEGAKARRAGRSVAQSEGALSIKLWLRVTPSLGTLILYSLPVSRRTLGSFRVIGAVAVFYFSARLLGRLALLFRAISIRRRMACGRVSEAS